MARIYSFFQILVLVFVNSVVFAQSMEEDFELRVKEVSAESITFEWDDIDPEGEYVLYYDVADAVTDKYSVYSFETDIISSPYELENLDTDVEYAFVLGMTDQYGGVVRTPEIRETPTEKDVYFTLGTYPVDVLSPYSLTVSFTSEIDVSEPIVFEIRNNRDNAAIEVSEVLPIDDDPMSVAVVLAGSLQPDESYRLEVKEVSGFDLQLFDTRTRTVDFIANIPGELVQELLDEEAMLAPEIDRLPQTGGFETILMVFALALAAGISVVVTVRRRKYFGK